jgi:hypothetical protein
MWGERWAWHALCVRWVTRRQDYVFDPLHHRCDCCHHRRSQGSRSVLSLIQKLALGGPSDGPLLLSEDWERHASCFSDGCSRGDEMMRCAASTLLVWWGRSVSDRGSTATAPRGSSPSRQYFLQTRYSLIHPLNYQQKYGHKDKTICGWCRKTRLSASDGSATDTNV